MDTVVLWTKRLALGDLSLGLWLTGVRAYHGVAFFSASRRWNNREGTIKIVIVIINIV